VAFCDQQGSPVEFITASEKVILIVVIFFTDLFAKKVAKIQVTTARFGQKGIFKAIAKVW